MQILREPAPDAALSFLQESIKGLGTGSMVQIVATCAIRYQGRARSMLHEGDRVLLLKSDGTFLVHTASKAKPVNWQPPGAIFEAALEDDRLVLTAYRARPEEMVRVEFSEVHVMLRIPLRDEAELALVGSEADLQRLLFERPELVEPGFVPRRRERDSKRGFYDIDGDDGEGKRLIVELKRGTAGVKEAQQLWRYVERLRGDGDVRGILMAPRIAAKARSLLADHQLEWRELDWDALLPQVEAMRRSGQVGLSRFTATQGRRAP